MKWLALTLCLVGACSKPAREQHRPPKPAAPRPRPRPSASVAAPEDAAADPAAPADAAAPRLVQLGLSIDATYKEKRLSWRKVEHLNWQGVADAMPPLPAEPAADPRGCPDGMLRVRGGFLLDAKGRADTDGVLLDQNRACAHFKTANRGVEALCDRFDRDRWLAIAKTLPRAPLDFCIDRYEFPDTYAELPLVVVRYAEAESFCKKVGKRLCTEDEWTFACEGEEGVPYPYGYERDATACRIDVLAAGPDKDTFRPRTTAHTAAGIDFAWHGMRSGEMARCKSPFGAMDMTGNVDEWTRNARKYGYKMILKGGHWGPARQRCRPATRGHGPMYVRYDQGFRCCADAP